MNVAMKVLLCALALCALTGEAAAQDTQRDGLKLPTAFFMATAAFDSITTQRAMAMGWPEENPLLAPIKHNRVAVGAALIGGDVLTIWISRKLNRNHPKIAKTLLYAGGAIQAGFGINNTISYERWQRRDQRWRQCIMQYGPGPLCPK